MFDSPPQATIVPLPLSHTLTLFVIGLAWLAAAGQLAALAAGRYAPYPAPQERPRRGPVRELIRTLVFAPRRRAGTTEAGRAVNQ